MDAVSFPGFSLTIISGSMPSSFPQTACVLSPKISSFDDVVSADSADGREVERLDGVDNASEEIDSVGSKLVEGTGVPDRSGVPEGSCTLDESSAGVFSAGVEVSSVGRIIAPELTSSSAIAGSANPNGIVIAACVATSRSERR